MTILVVGAGLAGATAARSLAEHGHRAVVIDQRPHVAGNAHDRINALGIRVHSYGAHIFHTSNERAWQWMSRFTEWLPYRHRVLAQLEDGTNVPFPPSPGMVESWGRDRIWQVFIRPYTEKMWGMPADLMDHSVMDRVLRRCNPDGLYFPDATHQALPKDGYTALVSRMLDHPSIEVHLSTPFSRDMEESHDHVFSCQSIDDYHGRSIGTLPYRSLRFTDVNLPMVRALPATTINFTHLGDQTRVSEWKAFPGHGDNPSWTTLTYETPCDPEDAGGERYYPIKDAAGANRELYRRYLEMTPSDVTFIGRCGLYAYIDMDQAVNSSLATIDKYISGH